MTNPRTGRVAAEMHSTSSMDPVDDEFAELPPKRHLPLLSRLIAVAILAVAAFGAGVMVQKNHDGATATAAAALPVLGAGAFPGGAGVPGGVAGGANGGGSASTSGTGSSTTAAVLIGTVVSVSGHDVTVKDLGGSTHVVHVADGVAVVVSTSGTIDSLKPGSTVTVLGTKATDGSVTATGVTSK